MLKTDNPSLCLQKNIKNIKIPFMVLALKIALRLPARPEKIEIKNRKK